jgi:hypothetical protein
VSAAWDAAGEAERTLPGGGGVKGPRDEKLMSRSVTAEAGRGGAARRALPEVETIGSRPRFSWLRGDGVGTPLGIGPHDISTITRVVPAYAEAIATP